MSYRPGKEKETQHTLWSVIRLVLSMTYRQTFAVIVCVSGSGDHVDHVTGLVIESSWASTCLD